MVQAAGTVALVPSYADPIHQFLSGRGELVVAGDGPAFTLWEALVHFQDGDYPIWAGGRLFIRDDLLVQAWQLLSPQRQLAVGIVHEEGVKKIRAMLDERGLDPDIF
jgi:hypothetical protein